MRSTLALKMNYPEVKEKNRLYFSEGNPWPQGHVIEHCNLDARIYANGQLRILIHLQTVDYRMNDGGEFLSNDCETDWGSKDAWNNYHACNIDGELLSYLGGPPISLKDIGRINKVYDALPNSVANFKDDSWAFNCYILGHDTVANNEIKIGDMTSEGYPISWRGKIALSYGGDYEFKHSFALSTCIAPLNDIMICGDLTDDDVRKRLAETLEEHDQFLPTMKNDWRYFSRPT